MGDTDPDKLEAALEQLETEKARRLQAKIEQARGPRCIENERGLGYRLARPSADALEG